MVRRSRPGPMRSWRSILGGATITPGFIIPSGSNRRLTSAKARRISAPYIFSTNSERERPHPRYAFGVGGVERRPDVQASHAGVAVEASPGTVLLDYLLEALDELLQPIRWHRRVLHKGDRFLFVARTEQERQGGLAEPDRLAHLLLCAQRRRNECPGFARQIVQFFEDLV